MGRFLATTEQDLFGPWVGLLMGETLPVKLALAGIEWISITKKALALLPEISPSLLQSPDDTLPVVLMQVSVLGPK